MLLCVACVQEIDTPNLHQRKMTVNNLLTQNNVLKLSLTYTNELGNIAYEDVPLQLHLQKKKVHKRAVCLCIQLIYTTSSMKKTDGNN